MREINFVNPLHRRTNREYLPRMTDNKVEAMLKAKQYGFDYWDGDRRYGYGGYRYDGRWKVVAEAMIKAYNLPPNAKILDVGCGKAHLLYEFQQLLPEAHCTGFDISEYGLADAPESIRPHLFRYRAEDAYPFGDDEFDLVISLACLHNLKLFQLKTAIGEIERVGRNKFVMLESFRNEREMFNLQCWALTIETALDVASWIWLYQQLGYTGDFEFIFFE
jgi:SAM-dependent methyltransferase